jgi:Domain of unknown function (DUF4252)
MKRFIPFVPALLLTTAMWAQTPQIRLDFEDLERRAEEGKTVKIDLPKFLIRLALFALPENDPDTAKVRKLVSSLQGIYVRSYEFASEGAYSPSELESIRKTITGSGWTCIVSVHSKKSGENTDVCLRQNNDKILGLAILSAEPKHLTIVNILGSITQEEFETLQGHFGVPKISISDESSKPKSKDKPKDDED